MHKLLDYICSELEDLESKADRDGSLTMSEIQYADTLLHMKKNLLKSEEMSDEYSYRGNSYGRGRKRDARGRYSAREDMTDQMREMMRDAPDEQTRQEFSRFISKLERM